MVGVKFIDWFVFSETVQKFGLLDVSLFGGVVIVLVNRVVFRWQDVYSLIFKSFDVLCDWSLQRL